MKCGQALVGIFVAWVYAYGISAYGASDVTSLAEHSDVLWYMVVGLGGVLYTLSSVLLFKGAMMLIEHDRRLTKLETRCEDTHSKDN